MQRFTCKTRIISGADALEVLGQLEITRLFLVTDPYFFENGTAQSMAARTGAREVSYFSDIRPDPDVEMVARGTAMVRDFAPDTIIALGGGSAMDAAKAMAFFSGERIRLVAIPTTSGSGSEVTDFTVLTHGGRKHPLVDDRVCPDVAILTGQVLEKMPAGLVADSGYDVLSHALEAVAAKQATAITEALATDAFSRTFALLPASFRGDVSVREEIHMAATMAGMAFNQAGLGLCHAMAHVLGGAFPVPHGRLNAILLPAVISVNASAVGARYAKLAQLAGMGSASETLAVRNLKNGLIRLRKTLELPESLWQAGVELTPARAEELVPAILEDPCGQTNPVPVTAPLVRQVLQAVAGRG